MVKSYTVAITGASGAIYGVRLIEALLKEGFKVCAVVSDPGKSVMEDELAVPYGGNRKDFEKAFSNMFEKYRGLDYFEIDDLKAPISSGSHKTDGMFITPCSMSTAASIANGMSKNLIERAADVAIKEGRRLVIVPRETPLSTIHLKNLLSLSQLGVSIVPAIPGFYNKPSTIDDMVNFVVGKALDMMGIENKLYRRWKE